MGKILFQKLLKLLTNFDKNVRWGKTPLRQVFESRGFYSSGEGGGVVGGTGRGRKGQGDGRKRVECRQEGGKERGWREG